MKNPWKTLNKKLIYSNPWIMVEEHEVITPFGHKWDIWKSPFSEQGDRHNPN